jgi:hypothetical protein
MFKNVVIVHLIIFHLVNSNTLSGFYFITYILFLTIFILKCSTYLNFKTVFFLSFQNLVNVNGKLLRFNIIYTDMKNIYIKKI